LYRVLFVKITPPHLKTKANRLHSPETIFLRSEFRKEKRRRRGAAGRRTTPWIPHLAASQRTQAAA
jgi:hypothetical protein